MGSAIATTFNCGVSLSSYAYFFGTFLSICSFAVNGPTHLPMVSKFFPYGIDTGIVQDDFKTALIKNVLLLGFFAIPHSIFARP